MIPIKDLLYELDMKLNNLASNKHQEIETKNKIIALNQAQLQFIKKRHNINNIYKTSFDVGIKRYEELEFLVVPHEEFTLTKLTGSNPYYGYETSLDKSKYFMYVDSYTLASKGECTDHPVINRLIKHSDLPVLYKNEHYKPSFEYQETLSIISDNKFIVYTDGTFSPNTVHISYLRYPREVDMYGYINFDGAPSVEVDSEFPLSTKDEILNLAVDELSTDTTNQNQIPLTDKRHSVEE